MIRLRDKGIKSRFLMTCPGSRRSVKALKEYMALKNIDHLIEYLGYVDNASFNQLVKNASVLLAPLPNNIQSISRFPTKLAFYLASGRPVVRLSE